MIGRSIANRLRRTLSLASWVVAFALRAGAAGEAAIAAQDPARGTAAQTAAAFADRVDKALRKLESKPGASIDPAIDSAIDSIGWQLAGMGSTAIPAIFEALAKIPDPERSLAGTTGDTRSQIARGQALLRALEEIPRPALASFLEHAGDPGAATGTKRAALIVLARVGSAQEMHIVLQVCAEPDGVEAASDDAFLAPCERAMREISRRDPRGVFVLEKHFATIPRELAPSVLKGMADSGAEGCPGVLARLLEREKEQRILILGLLAKMSGRIARPVDEDVLSSVRRFVSGADPSVLPEAEIAVARLDDADAIPHLISLLSNPMRGVRANALWSLQKISGLGLREDPLRWKAWYREESQWWVEKSADVLERLRSRKPAEIKAALAEIARRNGHRDVLAQATLAALDASDPAVVALACNVLARLRSRVALARLSPLLDHADAAVQRASWMALKSITGESLPMDSAAWRQLAAGS